VSNVFSDLVPPGVTFFHSAHHETCFATTENLLLRDGPISTVNMTVICGLRPSVLGQDRSQTKKNRSCAFVYRGALGLGLVILVLVLVLRIWSCLHHWNMQTKNIFTRLRSPSISAPGVLRIPKTRGIEVAIVTVQSYVRRSTLVNSAGQIWPFPGYQTMRANSNSGTVLAIPERLATLLALKRELKVTQDHLCILFYFSFFFIHFIFMDFYTPKTLPGRWGHMVFSAGGGSI